MKDVKSTNSKKVNTAADVMINRIEDIVNDKLKSIIKISSAIVDTVNSDGTINIYFPPDTDIIFSNLKNQTCFELNPGDGVEVLLKDGTYNNCWIIAKHEATFSNEEIATLKQEVTTLQAEIETLRSQIEVLKNNSN